ncbi:hypothetical protein SAMN02745784_03003 [Tissierella praeacuta DSM 18095]|uniref:Uncharacterized protein n=1 Tax=Tissierella praeacuta DSM 18095 TaxID=1123404 RepID=A0A1M4ZDP6_9FIRM|nr:hypothetical protein [Tissierella praeacuta]SHF15706.1 hypothetical protein SAMN02745784_03003 [Tissierella praeacuta DSM 18095]SUO99583.1 Uncharacterised protein [Tissierella praeacuta]
MLIVYRKSDKKILFNSGKSYVEPQGMSDINGKLAVIERIGGVFDDYGTFRLHDIDDAEKVDEILRYQNYVNLVFEDDIAVDYEIDYEKYEEDKIKREEQESLNKLNPSQEEILKAETEIQIITILKECELI